MAFVKKFGLISIFISIITIFLMSHNASAVDLVIDLNQYTLKRALASDYLNCTITDGVNNQDSNVTACSTTLGNPTGGTHLDSIETNTTFNVESGDLISFYFFVWTSDNYQLQHNYRINLLNGINSKFSILSYKEVTKDEYNTELLGGTGLFNYIEGGTSNFSIDFYNYTGFYKIYNVVVRANQKGQFPFGLTAVGTQGLLKFSAEDLGRKVNFRISNFLQYTFSGSEENKEQEEKTQEAVDESQEAGSSSSSSAQQGGANLLSAISGFFGVITSASPTNCVFNAPLNTYFGNERLNVDLCALDLPSGLGALTSIIAIGILIPFAIHMFNKFIALFRSFQS